MRTLENPQTGPNSQPDVLACTRKASHPRAMCLQPRMQLSPPQGFAPPNAHAVVPTRRPCTLEHTQRDFNSRATHLQPHTELSSPQDCAPSTPMKGVPTRGPRALNWAQRGSHSQTHGPCVFIRARSGRHHKDVCPQALTQWFPLAGHGPSIGHGGLPTRGLVPSTAHAVVPTCGPCALNRTRRGLHSPAIGPQLGTEGSRPMVLDSWRTLQMGPYSWAWCPHPHTEGTPPAGRLPSTAHGVVLTNRTLRPQLPRRASPLAGHALSTERSPLAGHGPSNGHEGVPTPSRVPSPAHGGVRTSGQRAFKHTGKDPHSRAAGPQLGTEGSVPMVRAP